MTTPTLSKLFEHNNWANRRILEACASLTDEQLDAVPMPTSEWSIRQVLTHFVGAQQAYLSLLTDPPESRRYDKPPFGELVEVADRSGAGLLELARTTADGDAGSRRRTLDGHDVEAWVVMLQAINHATDHRRQIGTMLRTLGLEAPNLDGWTFGEAEGALAKTSP